MAVHLHLSERDLEVLAHASLQSDVSVSKLAAQTNFREHTVRSSLKRLTSLGVLTPTVMMNPYVLGLTEYYVFFAVNNSDAAYQNAVKVLRACEDVFWVGELGSSFRFAASILAKSPCDLIDVLQDISAKLGDTLRESHVTTCYSYYLMTPSIFSDAQVSVPTRWYGDVSNKSSIDSIDHRILRALSKEPTLSLRELASSVRTPLSTVEYRIKSLRGRGIITGFHYAVSYEKIGFSKYHLCLHLSQNTVQTHRKIIEFCMRSSSVNYLAFLFGMWDAEIGVVVRHPGDTSTFLSEIYATLGSQIERIDFYPSLKTIKLEYYPFENFAP